MYTQNMHVTHVQHTGIHSTSMYTQMYIQHMDAHVYTYNACLYPHITHVYTHMSTYMCSIPVHAHIQHTHIHKALHALI